MLVKYDYTGKTETIYQCDRCKKILPKTQIKGIGVTNEKHVMIKKWDLCLRCYKALEKAMLKGQKNE